jgi:hypothetical protein
MPLGRQTQQKTNSRLKQLPRNAPARFLSTALASKLRLSSLLVSSEPSRLAFDFLVISRIWEDSDVRACCLWRTRDWDCDREVDVSSLSSLGRGLAELSLTEIVVPKRE